MHPSTVLGAGVRIANPDLVNIYGGVLGAETRVGPFVEIQRGVVIGARCKIQSHTFICEGVTIEDEVFVGHGVIFTNDLWPRAISAEGALAKYGDWQLVPTLVRARASIGSGATILPVEIGVEAMVAAGAVVTRGVAAYAIVAGNPARLVGDVRERTPGSLPAKARQP